MSEEVSTQNRPVLCKEKPDTPTSRMVVMNGSPPNRTSVAFSTPFPHACTPPIRLKPPLVRLPINTQSSLPNRVIASLDPLDEISSSGILVCDTDPASTRQTTDSLHPCTVAGSTTSQCTGVNIHPAMRSNPIPCDRNGHIPRNPSGARCGFTMETVCVDPLAMDK